MVIRSKDIHVHRNFPEHIKICAMERCNSVGLSGPFTTDQLGLAAENYSAVVSGTAVARATNNMRYISSFCIPQIGEDMA